MFNHLFSLHSSGNSETYQKIYLIGNWFEETFKELEEDGEEKTDVNGI